MRIWILPKKLQRKMCLLLYVLSFIGSARAFKGLQNNIHTKMDGKIIEEVQKYRVIYAKNLHINKTADVKENAWKSNASSLNMTRIKKEILHEVSGNFQSGELTAIMGPSGAGKSSLLNILTGFQTKGIGGFIKSNDITCEAKSKRHNELQKESCYIQQEDQLPPLFTVREMMNIACDLKLGNCISDKTKQLLIDDILETIGLSVCGSVRCNRLSGGQRKRLSIALELVDNPPVMFLDEPTTGLDSSSSLQCISMLKALACGGRTIVCTIHQPSATIFEMFDHIYVLAEGHCVYQGASNNVVPFLKTVGLQCPQYHNPADYLLEVANGEYGQFTDVLAQSAKENTWRQIQPAHPCVVVEEAGQTTDPSLSKTSVLINPPTEYSKFCVLFHKCCIQLYRDWTVTHLKIVMNFLIGILLGLNFSGSGSDGSKTIANLGYFICCLIYLSYTSLMPAILKFPQELAVLKKEHFNNWYSLRTYYFAFLVATVPTQMFLCMVYTSVSYFLSSQPLEWFRFAMFAGISLLSTLIAESIGLLLGSICNPVNGTFLGAVSTAFLMLFCGFLALFKDMSKYMYWVSYLDYMRYAMEGLVISMYSYGREKIPCPGEEEYCHFSDPKIALREVDMDNEHYWLDFGMLFIFLVGLRLVTFCTLKYKVTAGR